MPVMFLLKCESLPVSQSVFPRIKAFSQRVDFADLVRCVATMPAINEKKNPIPLNGHRYVLGTMGMYRKCRIYSAKIIP